jgi:nitrogen fixation/metabolism regulation signal transduction histidine kinase
MAEYYFDKGYKKRFIIRFVVGMVIISLTSCLLFFSIIPKETASRYVSLIYHMHATHQNLITILLIVGLFEVILALLFTLLLVLFISHKVGGPMYKLGQNIEQMTKGNLNLSEITFRDGDQGQVLATRYNEMLRSVRDNIKEVKYRYCKVQARMDPLEKSCLQKDSADKARMIIRIKHDLEKMQDILGRYSV